MSSRRPSQPPGAFPEESESENNVQVSGSKEHSEMGYVDPSVERSEGSRRSWPPPRPSYRKPEDDDSETKTIWRDDVDLERRPLQTRTSYSSPYDTRTGSGTLQSDIPEVPTHQPFTAENNYERLGWEGLSRSYSTGSHDLDRDYYYYTDGHATDGDDELSEKDFIMRKVPTTEDESRFLQTNKTRMSRTPAGETSTRSDRYYSGFNGGRHADITFETILGEHSSAFGTERPNVLKKLASDGKTTNRRPYTPSQTGPRWLTLVAPINHSGRSATTNPHQQYMSGSINRGREEKAELARSSNEAVQPDAAARSPRPWIRRFFPSRRSCMPSSFSSAEESDMETGLFVQSDVEYSVNKGPPMHPPRDQGPYPVRGTMTETNNPSATHKSVFGSLLNKLSSFLPGNISTSPAATTTDHPQMTSQILPDQISTTTTASPRRPIWEVLKDEKVNLMERGLQLLVQQTSTTGPRIAQLPDGRWVRANNSTQPTQTSTRGRRTVQLSDGRHVIINESSPCQASQATTEGPRIVRLPNGRRLVVDDSSSGGGGGSGFDRFTQSTQPQPTFMHNAAHQPVNSFSQASRSRGMDPNRSAFPQTSHNSRPWNSRGWVNA
ncbi:Hypothetical Protein CGB_D8080C [Cryptococcus gattii WM276]|uniref:Uncharacterized protein n=2 Tax=Cryptococcus gattii TaxID=37769 RepID=E6R4R9_CRYGW|nr:Hypothetical Protein CGB_D8080C [Cryptococcus gattii WM276]ADV22145.1 Hypothetical Protein CGB_D8080C [Cryptococcus gattii WM276]KIR80478.1 hypothetical protein I306_02456 [Cryptococcus gattii EJB2]KJE03416.1 hypothetical protein I311_02716 [Cryptococcus gattii NT-10]